MSCVELVLLFAEVGGVRYHILRSAPCVCHGGRLLRDASIAVEEKAVVSKTASSDTKFLRPLLVCELQLDDLIVVALDRCGLRA